MGVPLIEHMTRRTIIVFSGNKTIWRLATSGNSSEPFNHGQQNIKNTKSHNSHNKRCKGSPTGAFHDQKVGLLHRALSQLRSGTCCCCLLCQENPIVHHCVSHLGHVGRFDRLGGKTLEKIIKRSVPISCMRFFWGACQCGPITSQWVTSIWEPNIPTCQGLVSLLQFWHPKRTNIRCLFLLFYTSNPQKTRTSPHPIRALKPQGWSKSSNSPPLPNPNLHHWRSSWSLAVPMAQKSVDQPVSANKPLGLKYHVFFARHVDVQHFHVVVHMFRFAGHMTEINSSHSLDML